MMSGTAEFARYDGLFESPLLFVDTFPEDDVDQGFIDRLALEYDIATCLDGQKMGIEDIRAAMQSAIPSDINLDLEQYPWLKLTEELEQGLLSGKRFLFILDNVEKSLCPWVIIGKLIDFTIRISKFCLVNQLPSHGFFLIVALNGLGRCILEAIEAKKK